MDERGAILVKSPNWIGDCAMASPAVEMMGRALPEYDIHVLCRPHLAPMWSHHPTVKHVIAADDRKLPLKVRMEMKKARYAAAVLLTNSLGSAWMAFRLGARHRIGYARNYRSLLLTRAVPFQPEEWQTCTPEPLSPKSIKCKADQRNTARHLVQYYLGLAQETIQAIDSSIDLSHIPTSYHLQAHYDPSSVIRVNKLIKESGLAGRMLIGINPGAAHGPAKRWSPVRLGQIAEALGVKNAAIVSTASPAEARLNDEVQEHCGVPIHRLGEQLDIAGLIALIPRLRILITNDSGAMHLAAAHRVPVVAIFGPTDWNSTAPWNVAHRIIRSETACAPCFLRECPIDHRCMDNIDPLEVVQAATELIHHTGGYR